MPVYKSFPFTPPPLYEPFWEITMLHSGDKQETFKSLNFVQAVQVLVSPAVDINLDFGQIMILVAEAVEEATEIGGFWNGEPTTFLVRRIS